MVLNTGPLDWESSALTTRPLEILEYLLMFVWYSCGNCLAFFFVILTIQISQAPLKLTVLPPLNYKQDRLSISCIGKSNFFVVILVLRKCPNWQNCYTVFMLCKLDEILSRKC